MGSSVLTDMTSDHRTIGISGPFQKTYYNPKSQGAFPNISHRYFLLVQCQRFLSHLRARGGLSVTQTGAPRRVPGFRGAKLLSTSSVLTGCLSSLAVQVRFLLFALRCSWNRAEAKQTNLSGKGSSSVCLRLRLSFLPPMSFCSPFPLRHLHLTFPCHSSAPFHVFLFMRFAGLSLPAPSSYRR